MNEKDLMQVLGANIKRSRLRLDWSQETLAEKVNISVTFLSSIERGTKWLSATTAIRLAEALKVNIYELFKPENILPDNCQNVLNKYTEEVCCAMDKIRGKYVLQLQHR